MRPRTRSAGNLKTPMRRPERMTSWVRLSRASPKNAFQSPGASQRGSRRPGHPSGWSRQRTLRGLDLPDEPAHAVGQLLAPGEAAPMPAAGSVKGSSISRRPPLRRASRARRSSCPRAVPSVSRTPSARGSSRLACELTKFFEPSRHFVVVTPAEHRPPLTQSLQHSLKPQDRHFLQPSSYTKVACPHSLQRSPTLRRAPAVGPWPRLRRARYRCAHPGFARARPAGRAPWRRQSPWAGRPRYGRAG